MNKMGRIKKIICLTTVISFGIFSLHDKVYANNDNNINDEMINYSIEQDELISTIVCQYVETSASVDWKTKLNVLEENYDSIVLEVNNLEKEIIDDYIEIYTAQIESEKIDEFVSEYGTNSYPLAKAMSLGMMKSPVSYYNNYNRAAAVTYALNNYDDYNSAYPDWNSAGGDCANFASQCLYAGGIPMVGTAGNQNNKDMWYSYGTSQNVSNVSATWRAANWFKVYWMKKSRYYYRYFNYEDGYRVAKPGDIVQLLDKNKVAKHTYIVVGKDQNSSDLILACHTSDTCSARLSAKCNMYGGGYMIYAVK